MLISITGKVPAILGTDDGSDAEVGDPEGAEGDSRNLKPLTARGTEVEADGMLTGMLGLKFSSGIWGTVIAQCAPHWPWCQFRQKAPLLPSMKALVFTSPVVL